MLFCVEWNVGAHSEGDELRVETLEMIAERNRAALEGGTLPTNFVIGFALTAEAAQAFAVGYRALHTA